MFYNCHKLSVEDILKNKVVDRHNAEFSFAQNLLDNLGIPHNEVLDKKLLDYINEKVNNEMLSKMISADTGFQISFVKDPVTL